MASQDVHPLSSAQGLTVPSNSSTRPATGISDPPSRDETLINHGDTIGQEKTSGQKDDVATKDTEAGALADGQLHATPMTTETYSSNRDEKKEADLIADQRAAPVVDNDDSDRYLTGWKLFLVFVGMLLSIFLVSLDQTIVSTALPVIASQFNSLNDLTWVVSIYFFTQTGLVLTFGQLLTISNTKWLYLFAIGLFELGSLFCGFAWNMPWLIFARAVAGVGAAGIFISILTIIARVTRLEDRPVLFGAFGAVFAVSSVAGPLLGGAFTDHVSWRWCFYINLPFGALSILAVVLFLKSQPTLELPGNAGKTKLQKWIGIDWLGTVLCLGMIMPLLLALSWGGERYEWNDKIIIILFVVFAVMLILFLGWEYKLGPRAILPLHVFQRRTQIGCSLQAFLVMLNLIICTYYLPFYYQASRGRTPTESGIDILPYMLTIIISAALSGVVIHLTGRYIYFLRYVILVTAVGGGLLFTITVDTPTAKLIGFQILSGLGVGVALQNVMIACQAEWADKDELIPQATSVVTFFQLMGGILGIAIAGTVFANKFRSNVALYAPGLDPQLVEAIRTSLSALSMLSPTVRQQVVQAYVGACNYVFIVSVPITVCAALAGFLIKDHNVKQRGTAGSMAI